MKRLITGRILKSDTSPWQNGKVLFKRVIGSFTSENQYPPDNVIAFTNAFGYLYSSETMQGVYLWVNEEGLIANNYSCILPGNDSFVFSVPGTSLEPINLSDLRLLSEPVPNQESILNYIDSKLALSSGLEISTITVNETVSALRTINLVTGLYANPMANPIENDVLGLTTISAISGETINLVTKGEIFDNNWSWLNQPIYLGSNGQLTQVLPLTGLLQQVALVKNSNTIIFNPQFPINLN